jgi:Ca2+-transporting ATPase
MRRPPRRAGEPLFSVATIVSSMAQGGAVLAVIAGLYAWWQHAGVAPEAARAMAFVALIGGNLGLMLANRSPSGAIAATLREKNVPLYWVAGAAVAALALTLYWPPLQRVFGFARVDYGIAAACFGAGLAAVAAFEACRRLRRRPVPRALA